MYLIVCHWAIKRATRRVWRPIRRAVIGAAAPRVARVLVCVAVGGWTLGGIPPGAAWDAPAPGYAAPTPGYGYPAYVPGVAPGLFGLAGPLADHGTPYGETQRPLPIAELTQRGPEPVPEPAISFALIVMGWTAMIWLNGRKN